MKRLGILTLFVLLLLLAGGLWLVFSSPRREPRTWTLPDGSKVSFVSAEFGQRVTLNRYDGGWRDAIYPKLPRNFLARLRIRPTSYIMVDSNALVVWLKFSNLPRSLPGGNFSPIPPLRVSSEEGIESGANWPVVVDTNHNLAFYSIPNFPRRSRELILHAYLSNQTNNGQYTRQGPDMVIHNPVPSTAPEWTPEALPATRLTNGLEITLATLQTGLRSMSLDPHFAPDSNEGRRYSRADFDLRENGLPATNWEVVDLKAAAPTGDSFIADYTAKGWVASRYSLVFPGAFWDEEPAWEITAEASRTADFPVEELWKIKNIRVPLPGEAYALHAQTNRYAAAAELSGFAGPGAVWGPSPYPTVHNLFARLINYPPGVYLALVAVTDGQGNRIPMGAKSSRESATSLGNVRDYRYNLNLPTNTATIDVTLAVTRSRFATFRVKPTLAK